jgi:exosortase
MMAMTRRDSGPARGDAASWSVPWAAALVLVAAVGVWSQWSALAHITGLGLRDEEQSHVLLAPIVIAWMVWLRKSRLTLVPPRPSWLGPATVVGGWAFAWWGFDQGHQAAEHLGALVVVLGAVLSFTGVAALRQFLPAVPLLLFAVPVPGFLRQQIALPLQDMAAAVTFETLVLAGVDVARQGNVLEINGTSVAVAEACNGMRMVFALGLVVYAFVFSVPLRTSARIFLLALSPVIALVCNVIRLVPTALFFGYSDEETAVAFHDIAGWVMLLVALVILWKIVRLLEWLEIPVTRMRLAGRRDADETDLAGAGS